MKLQFNDATFKLAAPPEGVDVLYRAEIRRYSYVIDAATDHYGSTDPVLEINWYRVHHWTRTGARLQNGKRVFLNEQITHRQWASRTPAEAMQSFIERRKCQIRILRNQLENAEHELNLAKLHRL